AITGDWVQAGWYLDLVALCICLLGFHLLFWQQTGRHDHIGYRWFLVFVAFSPAPIHYLPSTDLLALSLFLLSVWGILSRKLWLSFPLLTMCAFLRYAYVPFFTLPVLFQLWQSRGEGKKLITETTVYSAFSGLIAGLFVLNTRNFGDESFLQSPSGWYPANLLHLDPFPVKSLVYYGLPHERQLQSVLPFTQWLIPLIAWLGSIFLVVWLMRSHGPKFNAFQRMWILVSGTILAMLAFLSVSWPPEDWNEIGFWTFLMETRYYIGSMGIMLVILFSQSFLSQKKWIKLSGKIMIWGSILIAFTYPAYIRFQVFQGNEHLTFSASPVHVLEDIVCEKVQKDENVLVASWQYSRLHEVYGSRSIDYDWLMRQNELHASDSVCLLVLAPRKRDRELEESIRLDVWGGKKIQETKAGDLFEIQLPLREN
ncbi:MAG: hypothetical protein AAF206_18285, partial [Bacteroidota bacterium]